METKKVNWMGHNLCLNCLEKHIITGKIEGKRRRGRRCQKLLADLKKTGYWNLKAEALDHTLWRTHFGKG